MKLATLQRAMSGYLIDAPNNDFAAQMDGAPGLGVYRNNYRGSLLACLRDTYDKCWAWLGDEAFDVAANAHINHHAPSSWTLDAYGHNFDQTLCALYPDDPELPEMAWLEWAIRRAFDGANAIPIDPTRLGDVDWEQAAFVMIPTLKLVMMTTNAAAIWSALDAEDVPPTAQSLPASVMLCVWRQDLSPCFRTLTATEARLLKMAQRGVSFGHMCQALASEVGDDEAAKTAGAALGQWLHDGLVIDFLLPEPS